MVDDGLWLPRRYGYAGFCVDCPFPLVPARQYVLSLSYALRFKMACSADATSAVLGAFISAINSDLRRRARKRKLRGRLQTGSLTVVQRFGSSLRFCGCDSVKAKWRLKCLPTQHGRREGLRGRPDHMPGGRLRRRTPLRLHGAERRQRVPAALPGDLGAVAPDAVPAGLRRLSRPLRPVRVPDRLRRLPGPGVQHQRGRVLAEEPFCDYVPLRMRKQPA
jgi:hypothetical protein